MYNEEATVVRHIILYTLYGSKFLYGVQSHELLHADLAWNVATAMASVPVLNTIYFSSMPSPFANPSKTNIRNQQLKEHGNAKDDHQPQQKKVHAKALR